MRKIITTLIFITIVGIGTSTAEIIGPVKIGNLYYHLDTAGKTAEVTYQKYGDNNNYSYLNAVDIPESVTYKKVKYIVTCINGCAFEKCVGLNTVTMPNTITSIGGYAFSECKELKSVKLSESITSIGDRTFQGCSNLKSIELPPNITRIGDWLFDSCSSLTNIKLPNSITSIGAFAFMWCSSLTDINIPSSVNILGNSAFAYCESLTSVNIPNACHTIGDYAFSYCISLTSITIPNSVIGIGEGAFSWCTSLKSINIPTNITGIEEGVFAKCDNLESILLPSGLTSIGDRAFWSCSNLTTIVIPDGVSKIGNWTFSNCPNLNIITIPNSVTSIGIGAFSECPNIIVYTASSIQLFGTLAKSHIIQMPAEQIHYYYPFSIFAKIYIKNKINEWQQKGEFEKTTDWQKRVTEQTRQQKVNQLLAEAEQEYIAYHNKAVTINPVLGKYDADNEVFAMTDSKFGTTYMAVPIDEAKAFKENWSRKKLKHHLQVKDDQIKLAYMTITMPNGKEYTYRNTDAVNYNLAEVEYNFEPLDINIPQSSAQTVQQGQQNITTTKVRTGKSAVDTDIPETNASNPNTFVIIFANEDYKNVASVPFAKNDGAIFQKYCQKTLGIPVSNIQFVENASFNDIRIKLAWLNDVCDAFEGKASVIVYYAGHGIPDEANKSAYLLPVDGDGRYVQSAYKLDDFYQKLGAMNAKTITIFMDACFSGSKREEGMLASARGIAIKARSGEPQGKMVVFSAATGDETAYPNTDEQHGMFTYYLLKKLQETKGDVTLQALGEYITTNVRQQSIVKNGKTQTPTIMPASAVADSWQDWKLK